MHAVARSDHRLPGTNLIQTIDSAARADAQALLVGAGDDAEKQTDLTIAEQGCKPLSVPPEDVCWCVRVTIPSSKHLAKL
jgi:hypothetical protein